jgi:hypothetical protein
MGNESLDHISWGRDWIRVDTAHYKRKLNIQNNILTMKSINF